MIPYKIARFFTVSILAVPSIALSEPYPGGLSVDPRASFRSNHITVPPSGERRYTIEDLLNLAARPEGSTLESLLALLPQRLRERYVLMYRSRSLQKASFAAPRAILFEGDGSLAVAFNGGDEAARGHDTLETVQFREATQAWEFREIVFAAGRSPQVSEINPKRCLECHQSPLRQDVDPRPNWEPYNVWPGAYGGVGGNVGSRMNRMPTEAQKLRLPQDQTMLDEQENEAVALADFLKNIKPKHRRYRSLRDFNAEEVTALTDLFVGANAMRVARLALHAPDADVYNDIVRNYFICDKQVDYPTFRTARAMRAGMDPAKLLSVFLPDALQIYFLPQARLALARLKALEFTVEARVDVLFEARGIDTSDWSMDFKTAGRFAFEERFGSPSLPSRQIGSALAQLSGMDFHEACAQSAARLSTNLPMQVASGRIAEVATQLRKTQQAAALPSPGPEILLNRCVKCHGATAARDSEAPWIPFDDLPLLRTMYTKNGYKHGQLLDEIIYRLSDLADSDQQMPPSGVVKASERQNLIDYLKNEGR